MITYQRRNYPSKGHHGFSGKRSCVINLPDHYNRMATSLGKKKWYEWEDYGLGSLEGIQHDPTQEFSEETVFFRQL